MAWPFASPLRQQPARARPESPPGQPMDEDAWHRHVRTLAAHGIHEPGTASPTSRKRPTVADEQALYNVAPSLADMLPWVEFLPESKCMLLDDGVSVAAFFELTPIGTEGREREWLWQARDAVENALQDSFDELDANPWVVQFYAQDDSDWSDYLNDLTGYLQPRASGTAFTDFYLRFFTHHLYAIGKRGGFFEDTAVTRLPWKGQVRRVRMVVYRRVLKSAQRGDQATQATPELGRAQTPEHALSTICDRLVGGLSNAGVKARHLDARDIHDWLLKWFNPDSRMLGDTPQDRARFYALTAYPQQDKPAENGEIELASGTDFCQRLFFGQPRSDVATGTWHFDGMPHRVMVMDRLRNPPGTGHLTGETRKGEAHNALLDQMPEDTVMCLTVVATPQDVLEAQLNHLSRKAVGETLDSEQTRRDVQEARSHIGSAHKLYRGTLAFYIRGRDMKDLDARGLRLANVMLNAGLQPVREEDEVAPLNTYLRWLPCVFDPAKDKRQWYTQLMFAQHAANLSPVWGRAQGTGHPGITFFNRGGGTITFDPLNRLDRQMNAHLFLFGPTGSGKSATLNNLLNQVTAVYRPRMFIVEAGNSFGLYGEFAKRLGLSVHRVKLSPGSGVSLAPFADAWRLIATPSRVQTIDPELPDIEPDDAPQGRAPGRPGPIHDDQGDEQRDVLGELEITARLMITGGEDKEEARMTRADRSLIRQCILNAAKLCHKEGRTVLTRDVCDALRNMGHDPSLPEVRRNRLLEMADAMDMFCQGVDGEMFDRPGTPWPEADITIVDLATFAREGYNAQLSIAYISLINTVNNIAERDQFLGRPIINVTDEGHIITKNPLLAPYVVKITKMWRKLGAWFWLATQNLDDLPKAAEPMLNMIEWWICLSMPPDEVEKIARFRELNPSQKALMLSARKQAGKYSEGVILSKSMEVLFRAVPPSLYLAMAMTEPEEKAERYQLMKQHGISELDAAFMMAAKIDRDRGIEPIPLDLMAQDMATNAAEA
jgi:conjugative transfer ATPase